jgi:K+-transporting ATPase KdpF subunit
MSMRVRSFELASVATYSDRTMENAIVGIVALGLIVYLFWTLIRPESF